MNLNDRFRLKADINIKNEDLMTAILVMLLVATIIINSAVYIVSHLSVLNNTDEDKVIFIINVFLILKSDALNERVKKFGKH